MTDKQNLRQPAVEHDGRTTAWSVRGPLQPRQAARHADQLGGTKPVGPSELSVGRRTAACSTFMQVKSSARCCRWMQLSDDDA